MLLDHCVTLAVCRQALGFSTSELDQEIDSFMAGTYCLVNVCDVSDSRCTVNSRATQHFRHSAASTTCLQLPVDRQQVMYLHK